jgi:hypothetical protein
MRKLALLGITAVVAFGVGCNGPFAFLNKNSDTGPVQAVPPVDKLVAYLNENSSRIQSVHYTDVALTASQGASIKLHADMMVQKPRNFRLMADLGGAPMVDLGSNDQEFWWWVTDRKSQKKIPGVGEQMYCSYEDLKAGRARDWKIPLDPEWVMEVLGMGTYSADKLKPEVHAETVDLVEKTRMNGRDVRKVIVFQRRPRQLPYPIVSDFKLLDDRTGDVICSAHISEIYLDKKTNAYLPRKVEINCPEMKAELALKMDYVAVNPGSLNPRNKDQVVNPGQPVPMSAFVRERQGGAPSRNLAWPVPVDDLQRVQAQIGK